MQHLLHVLQELQYSSRSLSILHAEFFPREGTKFKQSAILFVVAKLMQQNSNNK
jgi:hypothetical protein